MNCCCARGCLNFVLSHFPADAVSDVFANAARKQKRFLFNDADLLAQITARIPVELDLIQKDMPLGIVIKTRQQVNQGGLAEPLSQARQSIGRAGR
jgi:hypothetical protein